MKLNNSIIANSNFIKYRIVIECSDLKTLNNNIMSFIGLINLNFGIKFHKGIRVLPYKIKRTSVLRSPFVDKVSLETFEIRVYTNVVEFELLNLNNFFMELAFEKIIINNLKLESYNFILKKYKSLI